MRTLQRTSATSRPGLKARVARALNRGRRARRRPWLRSRPASPFDRYRLNVLVDNSGLTGAPVIVETNPTYGNLIGRVEMRAQLGTLVTDYRYIKPGALHRANGGYLLLDARVLLRQPGAWEALKQALRNRRIRIEDALQAARRARHHDAHPRADPARPQGRADR